MKHFQHILWSMLLNFLVYIADISISAISAHTWYEPDYPEELLKEKLIKQNRNN